MKMDVSIWFGSNTYGIRVGAANRDRYFERDWTEIEVEMDGTFHSFCLTKGFWNKCPEFRDRGHPVIKQWLRQHKTTDWPRGNPPRMSLFPIGSNQFRLAT